MRTNFATSLLLLLLAAPALADVPPEAAAEVGLADQIHGTVEAAGGFHDLAFFGNPGSKVKFTAGPDGTSGITPAIVLYGPDGLPVTITNGQAVLAATGEFTLRVTAPPGQSGRYFVTIKGKLATKAGPVTSPGGALPFGAPAGATFSWKLKNGAGTGWEDPDGVATPVSGTSGKGIACAKSGEYLLYYTATAGDATASVSLKLPKVVKREMWLSPHGFGPAPVLASAEPAEALTGDIVSELEVTGTGIDENATAALVLGGTTIPGTGLVALKDGSDVTGLRMDFDLTGAATGTWSLRVTNPSGATASLKWKVLSPGSVNLPAGVIEDTEVWYLEFTDAFIAALDLFGLEAPPGNETLNSVAAETVAAYMVYTMRDCFGVDGLTGKLPKDGDFVRVSFIVGEAPSVVGAPGVVYNRLVVGGYAEAGAPSDNPVLAWGSSGLTADTGNAKVDDIGNAALTALLPVASLDPLDTDLTTTAFRQAFLPMKAAPLTGSDLAFFSGSYLPGSDAEVLRMGKVITAIQRLGRELGYIGAHHVARAMGLANTSSADGTRISGLPTRFGLLSDGEGGAFAASEFVTLAANVKPSTLPGKSSQLKANYFRMIPGQVYLLPEATTTVYYSQLLTAVGGRPDMKVEDVYWMPASGSIPNGFGFATTGLLAGTAPFLNASSQWYYGVFGFTVTARDTVTGQGFNASYRLNLVIDENDLSEPEKTTAKNINDAQVRNAPDP